MITLTSTQLNAWLAAVIWPLTRVLAVVATAPLLGSQKIPVTIKIGLSLLITAVIVPMLDPMPPIDPASGEGLLVLVNQLLVGSAMGFVMGLVFNAIELAGDIAGLQMGLGFAVFYNPVTSSQTPVIGQFLGLLATLVFLAINGHLLVITALSESFRALPVAGNALSAFGWNVVAAFGAKIFLAAVAMALPIIVTMLTVNLALGVLTRAAPQLNIFAIGFPITVSVGLVGMLLTLPMMQVPFTMALERMLQYFR